jgi:hypothetical protein
MQVFLVPEKAIQFIPTLVREIQLVYHRILLLERQKEKGECPLDHHLFGIHWIHFISGGLLVSIRYTILVMIDMRENLLVDVEKRKPFCDQIN